MKITKILFLVLLSTIFGCSGGTPSISIQPTVEDFSENSSVNIKLDILWVADPSRSMFEETENVKANIGNFMQGIFNAEFDYRVGVISTAAWSDLSYQEDANGREFLVDVNNKPVFNRLHNGECNNFSASVSNANRFLSPENANNLETFSDSFDVYFDIYGSGLGTSSCGLVGPPFGDFSSVGNNIFADPNYNTAERSILGEYSNDERPLQSLDAFLKGSEGKDFIREDAFLAVVIITDEPDGSRDDLNPNPTFDSNQEGLHEAERYVDMLTDLKGSKERYAVYSIVNPDGSNSVDENIANLTGGQVVDINGTSADYAQGLDSIQRSIIESSSLFVLNGEPIVESIRITLVKEATGEVIEVQPNNGSGEGGYIYVPSVNGVKFIPPTVVENGDSLFVVFDRPSLAGGTDGLQPSIQLSNNTISENADIGETVGQFSIANASEVTEVSFILDSDTSNGGFSISPEGLLTVADPDKLDKEALPLHTVEVRVTGSGNFELERSVLLVLEDAVDSVPVAVNDQFIVSEASANASGLITVSGSIFSNDQGIDSSEGHSFDLTVTPSRGNDGAIDSNGTFTFTINRSELTLASGQKEDLFFQYTLTDTSGNLSSAAEIKVTIEGLNEPPVNDLVIDDVNIQVNNNGIASTVNLIPVSSDSSGISTGTYTSSVDGNATTGFSSNANTVGAHIVTYEMQDVAAAGSELYQVSSVNLTGAHSMGNTVIQVLSEDDQVLSREVLSIGSGVATGDVDFSTKAIGKKIKVIRPSGADNSDGDTNIQLNEISVMGVLADIVTINLDDHFTDPDNSSAGALTYFATDSIGEGPAPGWARIDGTNLIMVPPAGTDTVIGIVAEDASGATVFITFNVKRTGGNTINSAPIALLSIDDTQRGGLSLARYGGGPQKQSGPGGCTANTDPSGDNSAQYITWDEGDDFIDQLLDDEGNFIYPDQFDAILFAEQPDDGHGTVENGWNQVPTTNIDKYSDAGRILPLNNTERCYGESYTGFFVPDRTGLYRFRTNTLDDIVRLLVSTGEYGSELVNVITGTIDTTKMRDVTQETINSGSNFLGLNPQVDSSTNEFFPQQSGVGAYGSGHDTQIFFAGGIQGYQPGYIYLKEGNVYSFQIRFMEGGGSQRFDFEFDYREDGSGSGSWEDNWRSIDGIVSVPSSGPESHEALYVSSVPFVAFNSNELFYDSEFDVLEYAAEIVKADGSAFMGPGGTSDVSELGLSFNTSTGLLSGALNSFFDNSAMKPRIKFSATERFTPDQQSVESLVIKFKTN